MKKIYIAGKVSGLPIHEVSMKFGQAQRDLEAAGFEVVNPIAVVNDWHCPWDKAMKKCIAAMMSCDAVILLPDWMNSKGAQIEVQIAQSVNIPIATGKVDLDRLAQVLNESVYG